jgi:TonB family protein
VTQIGPTFLDYFGLREQPFGVTPDPAYLYLSQTHQTALETLSNAIRNDRGFMAVIAPPGMGKTTLLYHLLDQLRDEARTVLLFQTQCNSHEFFGHLLTEFGIHSAGMDIVEMHERLNKVLFQEMFARKRVVLVIDEAQNLAEPVLETIRLLSNFETPHAKLLQIIFAGQPQLAKSLALPALAQLRQRIAVVARLEPFGVDETAAYIRHRLKVAGYAGGALFSADAVAAIAAQSEGIPRNINNLSFNAMSLGFARESKMLGADIVSGAAAQLSLEPAAPVALAVAAPQPIAPRFGYAAKSNAPPAMARVMGPRFKRIDSSWVYASAAMAILALGGGWRISRSFGKQVRAAPEKAVSGIYRPVQEAVEPTLEQAPGATPQAITSLQFLLVSVQPNDTIKDISLRYLGRFDEDVLNQISALNPEVKNINQMAPGQLLRLPFPSGVLKRVYDSNSANSAEPLVSPRPAAQPAELSQPLPKERAASANVASGQPVSAVNIGPSAGSGVQEPSSNQSSQSNQASQRAAAIAEVVPNVEAPRAVSQAPQSEANPGSRTEATVAALAPSSGGLAAASSPPSAVVLPAASPSRSGKVVPAELIASRNPVYPAIAKNSKMSGSVEMHFKIGIDGKVNNPVVVKGPPLLAQAAMEALQGWRYKPATLDGSPIESEATTVFDFKGN